jgi:hypothetical protein
MYARVVTALRQWDQLGVWLEREGFLRENVSVIAPLQDRELVLANNQLDALFHIFIYFTTLPVSSITVLIIRRSNCINTSSGMISLCK